MAEIVLEHMTKEFAGGVRAVDDVTLHIPDGQFLARPAAVAAGT